MSVWVRIFLGKEKNAKFVVMRGQLTIALYIRK